MERHILVADIGGTNPRIAMVKATGLHSFQLLQVGALNINNPDFVLQINEFLKECGHRGWTTDTACFAIAGPITNNACFTLNHAKFPVDGNALTHQTALKHVVLINDFEAIGHEVAVANLTNEKMFFPVPRPDGSYAPIDPHGNRAIIGPGTGLGVAYLPHQHNGEFDVVASEGGHASAPIHSVHAMELALFIAGKLGANRVDTEAVVSGKGIRHIADFLLTHPETMRAIIAADPVLKSNIAALHESIPSSSVRNALLNDMPGTDKDAAAFIGAHWKDNHSAAVAMHLFMGFLGDAAQDVAVHGIATGGLILGGGIPAKNREALLQGQFMRSFLDALQPAVQDLLKKVPVFISRDYDVSFFGCARKALLTFDTK